MKHLILTLLIGCTGLLTFSQTNDWAPVGAKWWYDQWNPFGPDDSYACITSKDDTIINGYNCRILEIVTKSSENDPGFLEKKVYTFSDSGTIYYTTNTVDPFRSLYHFNVKSGDTVAVYPEVDYNTDSIVYVIDSVGLVQLSGANLQVVYSSIITTLSSDKYYMSEVWYSGIGSSTHFFPQDVLADPPLTGNLRCYFEDSIGDLSFVNYPCDTVYVTSVKNVAPVKFKASIDRNNNQLMVRSPDSKQYFLQVFDLLGRQLFHGSFNKEYRLRLPANRLVIIQIYDTNNTLLYTQKILNL